MPPNVFRLNEPKVVAETVDGEVMVINLETGSYYNLREAGAVIWDALIAGATVDRSVAQVQARFDGPADEISATVRSFVADLEREQLIVPSGDPSGSDAGPTAEGAPTDRRPFTVPVLEPYVDLQNLIQLDPILEQDEQGWPIATEGNQP